MKEGLRNESEKVGPPGTANGLNVFIIKSLNFVFRKDVLVANSETVAAEFKNALLRVNEECNLLQQDHLARGKIVEAVSVSSTLEKPEGQNARWYTYIEDLWQPLPIKSSR